MTVSAAIESSSYAIPSSRCGYCHGATLTHWAFYFQGSGLPLSTVSPFLSTLDCYILNLANMDGITLIPANIPSHLNVEADCLSWGKSVLMWQLSGFGVNLQDAGKHSELVDNGSNIDIHVGKQGDI